MYYGTKRRLEGLKALLSLAAIAAGVLLSDMAAAPASHGGGPEGDVVGVWRWVLQSAEGPGEGATSPVLEIRRATNGSLRATIGARAGHAAHGAHVTFDAGNVCMTTGGASFSGKLSEDGSRILGKLQYGGSSTSAMLERVKPRRLGRAAGRGVYST